MDLYRVHNWDPTAAGPSRNGHPLYIWPRQGNGRVDDPEQEYLALYLGSDPEGAVAEAFGRFAEWTEAILSPPPGAAGTRKALIRYSADVEITDLDDPGVLLDLGLRPSQVITRDTAVTQAWARRIYEQGDSAGVSWWSFYGAQWASVALWDLSGLTVVGDPEPLTLDHPAVTGAADRIARIIRSPKSR